MTKTPPEAMGGLWGELVLPGKAGGAECARFPRRGNPAFGEVAACLQSYTGQYPKWMLAGN